FLLPGAASGCDGRGTRPVSTRSPQSQSGVRGKCARCGNIAAGLPGADLRCIRVAVDRPPLRALMLEARHEPVVIAGIDESHIGDPPALVPGSALDAEAGFVARDLQALRDLPGGIERRDLMLGLGPWDTAEEPASR